MHAYLMNDQSSGGISIAENLCTHIQIIPQIHLILVPAKCLVDKIYCTNFKAFNIIESFLFNLLEDHHSQAYEFEFMAHCHVWQLKRTINLYGVRGGASRNLVVVVSSKLAHKNLLHNSHSIYGPLCF